MTVIILMGTKAAIYEKVFSKYVKHMILMQINAT